MAVMDRKETGGLGEGGRKRKRSLGWRGREDTNGWMRSHVCNLPTRQADYHCGFAEQNRVTEYFFIKCNRVTEWMKVLNFSTNSSIREC